MSIINHGGCAWRGDNHYKWNKPPVSPNAEDKKPGAETDDIIFTRNKLQGNSRGATVGVTTVCHIPAHFHRRYET